MGGGKGGKVGGARGGWKRGVIGKTERPRASL
jgi:hypothetical protein